MKTASPQSLVIFSALVISAVASAQVPPAPICPSASNVVFIATPPAPSFPITSLVSVSIGIRSGSWDFVGENIAVSGFNINMDAPSEFVGFPSIPIHFAPIGVLPAGTYSVTIRPVARNVTPSVACPQLVVPLVIPEGASSTPVPSTGWLGTALLMLLLGIVALTERRRRSRVS